MTVCSLFEQINVRDLVVDTKPPALGEQMASLEGLESEQSLPAFQDDDAPVKVCFINNLSCSLFIYSLLSYPCTGIRDA